jgi:NitT/TauT family transport system substrate-binding protein
MKEFAPIENAASRALRDDKWACLCDFSHKRTFSCGRRSDRIGVNKKTVISMTTIGEAVVQTIPSTLTRVIAVAAVLALGSIFHGSASAQQKPTAVRAAYVPVATWLPAWVAKDKGIFMKHGLDVTLTPVQNLSLLPGTVGRQFEFAASTAPDLLKAVAGGLDVVATAGEAIETKANPVMQLIVRKDSGIKGPKDLKGKVIAAPTLGAVMHSATLYWLKKNGVDPSSIRGVEVPFPNMGDQLKAGSVDAVEGLVPFTTAMLAAGNVSLGDPMMAVGDEVIFPFWISSGTWARANLPTIKAWIAALTETKMYMDAHPKETREVLGKYSHLPPAIVQKVPLPTYRFTIKPQEMAVWTDVLTELGQLPGPVDKSKLVVTAQ